MPGCWPIIIWPGRPCPIIPCMAVFYGIGGWLFEAIMFIWLFPPMPPPLAGPGAYGLLLFLLLSVIVNRLFVMLSMFYSASKQS